jgi:dipeptidase E
VTTPRRIVAMGGGGFSMETSPLLDDHALSLARRRRPRVCFLPTASGDGATYIAKFYRAFAPRDCVPTDLTLFDHLGLPRRPERDDQLAAFLSEQDVVYVGGGNTASMLVLWREHGLDRALRAAYESGVVMCGLSAGMNCWFECSVTDSYGPLAALRDGVGLVRGSACPHYDGEAARRPTYHALVAAGLAPGYAADDGAALCFVDGELHEVVSSRPNARAYRVERGDGRVVETALPTRFLGQ